MTDTHKRVLTSAVGLAILGAAAYFGLVQFLVTAIAVIMGVEILYAKIKTKSRWPLWVNLVFFSYWMIFIAAAYSVGQDPWSVFLLFLIISAADTGAWFFGRLIGGDKLWERITAGKTWSGIIAGMICGTVAAIMYGVIGAGIFLASLMWIGMAVATLSQYGDLTESWIKRKLGIKDFANTLPGHGGLADRFDGWIYVLPIAWLAML